MRSRSLLLVLLAAAAVTAVLGVLLNGSRRPSAPAPDPSRSATPAPDGRGLTPSAAPLVRTAVDEGAAQVDGPLAERLVVAGRVVDLDGQPLSDLALGVRDDERDPPVTVRSGEEGRFALLVEATPCEVEVVEPGWTTVRFGAADLAPVNSELVVVAARSLALEGVVVEASGSPLAGAALVVRLEPALATALGSREGSSPSESFARSGSDGRFRFERLPAVPKIHLRTALPDWCTDERELALPATDEVRIVLRAAEPRGPVLEGTVVHPDGTPAPGALVALGAAQTRAGEQGRFRLFCGWCTAETPLVAVARGYQPAILAGYGGRIDPLALALPPERLQLPGLELALAGKLVDASGAPLKGWRVRLEDPTPLDPGGTSRACAESALSGRDELRTDSSGAFRFTGLSARTYTLLAWDRDRASRCEWVVRSQPVPAGTLDVLLRVDLGERGCTLSGRIVDDTGAAIADALVGLGRVAVQGGAGEHALQARLRARSDADGRFELVGAPPGALYLVATHPSFLPQRIELPRAARGADLLVRLDPLRPFRFESAAASEPPDRLRAAGANGPAALWSLAGAQPTRTGAVLLVEGRSPRLSVGPDAREIVIYRGLVELARFPVPARAPNAEDETLIGWP